jgi:hypothetical protein
MWKSESLDVELLLAIDTGSDCAHALRDGTLWLVVAWSRLRALPNCAFSLSRNRPSSNSERMYAIFHPGYPNGKGAVSVGASKRPSKRLPSPFQKEVGLWVCASPRSQHSSALSNSMRRITTPAQLKTLPRSERKRIPTALALHTFQQICGSLCLLQHFLSDWTDIRFISSLPSPKRALSLILDVAEGTVPTDNCKCLIMRPVLPELFWKPTYFRPRRTFASRRLLNRAREACSPDVAVSARNKSSRQADKLCLALVGNAPLLNLGLGRLADLVCSQVMHGCTSDLWPRCPFPPLLRETSDRPFPLAYCEPVVLTHQPYEGKGSLWPWEGEDMDQQPAPTPASVRSSTVALIRWS